MKTIKIKMPKLYNLIGNIDFSTEESYNNSLKDNFENLLKICRETDILSIKKGGISGFEKEIDLSIEHVNRIENTRNIEYKNLKETKDILYARAKKRLNSKKENEMVTRISTPRELTKHIISVAMDNNEKNNTIEIDKFFGRGNNNARIPKIVTRAHMNDLISKNQKIKNINETLVTPDMVGLPIGDVFGEILGPIFSGE